MLRQSGLDSQQRSLVVGASAGSWDVSKISVALPQLFRDRSASTSSSPFSYNTTDIEYPDDPKRASIKTDGRIDHFAHSVISLDIERRAVSNGRRRLRN